MGRGGGPPPPFLLSRFTALNFHPAKRITRDETLLCFYSSSRLLKSRKDGVITPRQLPPAPTKTGEPRRVFRFFDFIPRFLRFLLFSLSFSLFFPFLSVYARKCTRMYYTGNVYIYIYITYKRICTRILKKVLIS